MKILKHLTVLLLFAPLLFMATTCPKKQDPATLTYTMPFSHIGTRALTYNSSSGGFLSTNFKWIDSILTVPNLDSFLNSKNYDPSKVTIQSVKFSGADVRITSPGTGTFQGIGSVTGLVSTNMNVTPFDVTGSDLEIINNNISQSANEVNSGFSDKFNTELKGLMNQKVKVGLFVNYSANVPKMTLSVSLSFAVTVQPN